MGQALVNRAVVVKGGKTSPVWNAKASWKNDLQMRPGEGRWREDRRVFGREGGLSLSRKGSLSEAWRWMSRVSGLPVTAACAFFLSIPFICLPGSKSLASGTSLGPPHCFHTDLPTPSVLVQALRESRNRDRIKHARNLLGEMPVGKNVEARGGWKSHKSTMQTWLPVKEQGRGGRDGGSVLDNPTETLARLSGSPGAKVAHDRSPMSPGRALPHYPCPAPPLAGGGQGQSGHSVCARFWKAVVGPLGSHAPWSWVSERNILHGHHTPLDLVTLHIWLLLQPLSLGSAKGSSPEKRWHRVVVRGTASQQPPFLPLTMGTAGKALNPPVSSWVSVDNDGSCLLRLWQKYMN